MPSQEQLTLIAPCGLYCGNCPLFLARTDESLRQKIAEGQGIPVEQVRVCAGCRSMRGRAPFTIGGDACENYICAIENKRVKYCYECEDFPCLKLAPCADRASEIPHNTKIYNLLLLKKEGADSLIQNDRNRRRQYFRGKKPKAGSDIQI